MIIARYSSYNWPRTRFYIGTTLVCGDSHTSTHGAFGSLAFGIGTPEAEHVLSTQTLIQNLQKIILLNLIINLVME